MAKVPSRQDYDRVRGRAKKLLNDSRPDKSGSSAVRDFIVRRTKREMFRLNLSLQDAQRTPLSVAEDVVKLRSRLQLPTDVIASDLEFFKEKALDPNLDPVELRHTPEVARFIKAHPFNAKVSIDDIMSGALGETEMFIMRPAHLWPKPDELVVEEATKAANRRAEEWWDANEAMIFQERERLKSGLPSPTDIEVTPRFSSREDAFKTMLSEELNRRRSQEEYIRNSGKVGAGEQARKLLAENPLRIWPFLGQFKSTSDAVKIWFAAARINDGEGTEGDIDLLENFTRMAEVEEMRGGADMYGIASQIALDAGAFLSEFALGGVAFRFTTAATLKVGKRLAERRIRSGAKKALRSRIGARIVGLAAGTGIAQGIFVPGEAFRRAQPGAAVRIGPDDRIVNVFPDEADSFSVAIPKALVSAFAEFGSEMVGGSMLAKAFQRKLNRILFGWWKSRFTTSSFEGFARFTNRFGYHGVLAEMGEERVADLIRMFGGAQPFDLLGVVPEFIGGNLPNDQLGGELLGFLAIGAPFAAVSTGTRLFGNRIPLPANEAFFDSFGRTMERLKLRETSPQDVRTIVRDAARKTGTENVYIDKDRWNTLVEEFNQTKPESERMSPRKLYESITKSVKEYDRARADGDLRFRIEDYASDIAPNQELNQKLKKDLRRRPLEMTEREIEEGVQEARENLERAEKEAVTPTERSTQHVLDEVQTMLTNAKISPQDAEFYSHLYEGFRVLGTELQRDPTELFGSFGINIRRFASQAEADRILREEAAQAVGRPAAPRPQVAPPKLQASEEQTLRLVTAGGIQGLTEEDVQSAAQILRDLQPDLNRLSELGLITAERELREGREVEVFRPAAPPAVPGEEFRQTVAIREGEETLRRFGLDPKLRHRVREVAVALEEFVRATFGTIGREDRSDEAADRIANWIVEEVLFELRPGNEVRSGVGWYSTKFQQALDEFGEVFSELVEAEAFTEDAPPGVQRLGSVRAARNFMTALLAVTSDGQRVDTNFRMARRAYEEFRRDGKLNRKFKEGGERQAAVRKNFETLNSLLDEHGPEEMHAHLLSVQTVSEINKARRAAGQPVLSDYPAAMEMPRAAILLGPKIGAFYANLMGSQGYLTMDRWWVRSFNRYRGLLIPEVSKKGLKRFKKLIKKPRISDERAILLTGPLKESYEAKNFKKGTPAEVAANTLYKQAFDLLEDAPFNASDRAFMVKTARVAQEKLARRGQVLTIADIQAILWYYEKRLYGELGSRQSDDISYAESARKAVGGRDVEPRRLPSPEPGEDVVEGPDGSGFIASPPSRADAASGEEFFQRRVEPAEPGRRREGVERRREADEGAVQVEEARPAEGVSLPNLPSSSFGPNGDVQFAAQRYAQEQGFPVRRQSGYVRVDPKRAARIGEAFGQMQHDPADPETMASYEALIAESLLQYQKVKELGIKIEFLQPGQENPYAEGSHIMLEDIKERKHLWVFGTESGFGADALFPDNPLLRETNEFIGERQLVANDVFRIVHDIFGHAKEGFTFGPRGEENAWQAHVRMYSPLAARAMTTETRGQNSWVNFGPLGEENQARPKETRYADQKIGLLPSWVMEEGLSPDVVPLVVTEQLFARAEGEPIGRTRIAFGPAGTQISIDLFKGADESTFIHETFHVYMLILEQMVKGGQATKRMREDFETLVQSQGWSSLDAWLAASRDAQKKSHEIGAKQFEVYIREGKAPSTALRRAFRRFKSWMAKIYRTLRRLNVPMTDDVRGVFDRLLATKEEIAAAQIEQEFAPLFPDPEAVGMEPAEAQSYSDTIQEYMDAAEEELLEKALKDLQKEQDKRLKNERDAIRKEVAADVDQTPAYIALANMQKGTKPDGSPLEMGVRQMKLDRAALKKDYADLVGKLPSGISTTEGGVHPNHAADFFEFQSGREMLEAMVAAPKRDALIKTRTDIAMQERFALIKSEEELKEEAQLAVHHKKKSTVYRKHLEWLAGQKFATFKGLGRRLVRSIPRSESLEQEAEDFFRDKTFRDIQPHVHQRTEKKAYRASINAMLDGRWVDAFNEQRTAWEEHERYRVARRLRDKIQKEKRFLQQFNRKERQEALGNAGGQFQTQVNEILTRVDLRENVPTKKIAEARQILKDWVDTLEENGENAPVIGQWLLNEGNRINWKDIPSSEFIDIADSVRSIWWVAREQNQIKAIQDFLTFKELEETLVKSIVENSPGKRPRRVMTKTEKQERRRLVAGFIKEQRKVPHLAFAMDGFKRGGAAWKAFIRPLNRAANEETSRIIEVNKRLLEIWKPYSAKERLDLKKEIHIPEWNDSLTKMGIIMMALNWGNQQNRTKLVAGLSTTLERPVPEEEVFGIIDRTLEQRDWKFVRDIWDYFSTFWPEIRDIEKRATGVAPERVEALPFRNRFGEEMATENGYFPIVYDSRQSRRVSDFEAEEEAKRAMRGRSARAQTKRNHAKTRTEDVGKPLLISSTVIYTHLKAVVHDITHTEPLREINKVLNSQEVQTAIIDHHGDLTLEQFLTMTRDVAAGDLVATSFTDRVFNWIRSGSTIAAMAWNIKVALMQPLGLTQSMARIGAGPVARAIREWLGTPEHMQKVVDGIYRKSKFMRDRGLTQMREISEIRNRIEGGSPLSVWADFLSESATAGKVKLSQAGQTYFFMIVKLQLIADIPTWLAAYHKAWDNAGELKGQEAIDKYDQLAVDLADQEVIATQGGGHIKDLAKVQRGTPVHRLFTNFLSFFQAFYNISVDKIAEQRLKVRKGTFAPKKDIPQLAVDFLLLVTLPAFLSTLLQQVLRGDEEEGVFSAEFAKRAAADQASYILGSMFLVRETAGFVQGFTRYEGPTGTRLISSIGEFYTQATQGDLDAALFRTGLDVAGQLFHFPANQIQKTTEGIMYMTDGETLNPGVLIAGPPRER